LKPVWESPESGGRQDNELPDWLRSSLGSEEKPESSGEDLPDWLSSLKSDAAGDEPDLPEAESDEPATPGELPDWLANMRSGMDAGSSGYEPDEPEMVPPVEDETDWMLRIRGGKPEDENAPPPETPAERSSSGLTDWLAGLEDSSTPGAQSQEPEPASNVPDWLKKFDSPSEETPSEEQPGDIPDWLKAEPEAEASTPPAETPLAAGSQEFDIPDWLKAEPEESPSAPAEPISEPQAEASPDWLQAMGLGQPSETPPAGPAEPPEEEPAFEIPDWMREMGAEGAQPTASEAASNEEEGLEAGELPDWMHSAGELDFLSDSAPAARSDAGAESFDLPDWLQEIKPGEESSASSEAEAPSPFDEPSAAAAPATDMPDWVSNLFATSASAPDDQSVEGAAAFAGEFDWMQAEAGQPAETGPADTSPFGDEAEIEPAEQEDLPEWLTGAASGAAMFSLDQDIQDLPQPPAESEPASSEISPADLPSWVEAMRPVAASDEGVSAYVDSGAQEERAGPLAGLKGLIPAEPLTQPTKPPPYSVKLQVTDGQKAHAELFSELVKTEGESAPLPARRAVSSQGVLRWLIALVLLAVALGSLLTGFPDVPLPFMSPEVEAAQGVINALPPESRVLVAFDYEPGLSGEMDAAASTVIEHLMLKGAYLAVVSSVPTGPIQAERVISMVNSRRSVSNLPPYTVNMQYTNLGFVPGGATGLRSFAELPQATLPLTVDGSYQAWTGALSSVRSLADFETVVVLTENPDVARSWVEQVQPILEGQPLVMVVSAQAEPLVRPYGSAGSQQVQGIVSGLHGVAGYENYLGFSGPARQYWGAFSITILAAIALIILGGLVNIMIGLFRAGKGETQG